MHADKNERITELNKKFTYPDSLIIRCGDQPFTFDIEFDTHNPAGVTFEDGDRLVTMSLPQLQENIKFYISLMAYLPTFKPKK